MIDPLRSDLVPLALLGGIGTYAARALPPSVPSASTAALVSAAAPDDVKLPPVAEPLPAPAPKAKL